LGIPDRAIACAAVVAALVLGPVTGRCRAQVFLRNTVPRLTAPLQARTSGHVFHAVPPKPRFHQSNILPDRIQPTPIPKANFPREDIRPRRIEIDTIAKQSVVWQKILLQQLPRGVVGPPRLDAPAVATQRRLQFDSQIFLPPLPPPALIHGRKRDDSGRMPNPNHRRLLGW